MTTNNRELRLKTFAVVHDFLEDHYDYDFPRADPDGSHTYEALELTELLLSEIDIPATEKVRREGDIDVERLRKYLRDGTIYVPREEGEYQ